MLKVAGVPMQGGLSIGPIHFLHRANSLKRNRSSLSPREEMLRFEAAKDRAITELKRLEARIAAHLGSDEAAIFLFQSSMLEDEDYLDVIRSYINASATVEYAVEQTEKAVIDFFASLDSSYLRARTVDAKDLSRRLTGILSDKADIGRRRQRPAILVADELTPSETALLDSGMLLGLVSRHGSTDSHTAILAHAIGVPAIYGVEVDPRWEGHIAILDGDHGTLIIDPDEATIAAARPHAAPDYEPAAPELTISRQSYDGRAMRLCAMIDSAWEAVDAYAIGAGGIATYRTNVLHKGRATPPSEEEQLVEYRRAIEAMHGRPVAIQSLDVGGIEGPLSVLVRQERYQPLKTQLRAVLRAAVSGPASFVLSGVRARTDLRRCRQLLRQCQRELAAEGKPYSELRIGVEINTPAALFFVDSLSAESDFLLLDGEALMQSTIYNHARQDLPNYRALGWMLHRALTVGHHNGCNVVMSGNLDEFPQVIGPLLELGFDDLSVPVHSLLPLYDLLSGEEQAQ